MGDKFETRIMLYLYHMIIELLMVEAARLIMNLRKILEKILHTSLLYNVKNVFDYKYATFLYIYLGNNIHCSRNWNEKYRTLCIQLSKIFCEFIALIPFLFFLEKKNTIKIISKNKKRFLTLSVFELEFFYFLLLSFNKLH